MDELNFLLSATQAYANNAINVFNFFLTVVFGSFAFAAAMPLRNIGRLFTVGKLQFSSSSLVIGFVFLCFYSISFFTFYTTMENVDALLFKIQSLVLKHPTLADVGNLFLIEQKLLFGLGASRFGFLIGSIGGWIIFMWITNTERKK